MCLNRFHLSAAIVYNDYNEHFVLQLPSGEEIPLPPIVLGRLGSDPGKKTVCIYGHLDVQPASIEDGWDTEPFKLVEKDGKSKTYSATFGVKFPWDVCKMKPLVWTLKET